MARKKAEKYLGNAELKEGFAELFTYSFPHLNPIDTAVDNTDDEATARVSFTMSRPLTADVEKAREAQAAYKEEVEKMLADLARQMEGDVIEGEASEVTDGLATK